MQNCDEGGRGEEMVEIHICFLLTFPFLKILRPQKYTVISKMQLSELCILFYFSTKQNLWNWSHSISAV